MKKNVIHIYLFFTLLIGVVINAQEIVGTNSIVSPPQASRLGNASIALPFDLPSDVTAFKPDLNLYYNSDGSSSWVGYGFSLGTSSITIDDRWGVPLFSATEETELYSLDGMQLIYPENYLPHRHSGASSDEFDTSYQAKSVGQETIEGKTVKSFQPRKKTIFSKIERFGNSPKNYYWKVTHTNGTIQWFGGDKNGLRNNYVIKTAEGNVVEWALVKTIDRHGNFIKYDYNKGYTGLTGANSNLLGGEYFYPGYITYTGLDTGTNSTPEREGATRVKFNVKKTGSNTFIRPDVFINAKSGAKKVDAKLLESIEIQQKENGNFRTVKSFEFTYENGAFKKQLLTDVIEKNREGNEAFSHKFDYFKLQGPIYNVDSLSIIDKKQTLVFQDVDVSMPLDLDRITGNAVLSRSKSTEWGWEVRPGLGLQVRPFILPSTPESNRTFTVGLTYGQSYSNSIDLMGLIDINGDGLKDIVFKGSDGIKFKPRIKRRGSNIYGSVKSIGSLGNIGVTKGKSVTLFPNSIDFRSKWASFGRKRFKNTSKNSVYMTDANADMLMDVVDYDSNGNSIVYFNHIVNGTPTFTSNSSLTPNMLITASPASEVEVENPTDDEEEEEFPNLMNHDAVKVWTSFIKKQGYDSSIPSSEYYVATITDSLEFIPSTSDSKLRYTIEFYDKSENRTTEIFNHLFDANDESTLKKKLYKPYDLDYGDMVFFRLHKNKEGVNDILKTNPTIFYDKKSTGISEHNFYEVQGGYGTSYGKDLLLSSQKGISITESSQITIDWEDLIIPSITNLGDITYSISRVDLSTSGEVINTEELFSHNTSNGNNIRPSSNLSSLSINVSPGAMTVLSFQVRSNRFIPMEGNVDVGIPYWKPKVRYQNTGMVKYPIVFYNNYTPIKYEKNRFRYTSIGNFSPYQMISVNTPEGGQSSGFSLNIPSTNASLTGDLANLKGEFRFVLGNTERKIVVNNGSVVMLNMENQQISEPSTINGERINVGLYADNVYNTELLSKVRDALCFEVKYKLNGTWQDHPNYGGCYSLKFRAYGKQNENLGSNQMGWGQFFYDDSYDKTSPLVNGEYKLINLDILKDPSMGEQNSSGISQNDYDDSTTVDDVETDIQNGLDFSGNEEDMDGFLEDNAPNPNSFKFPFLPTSPIRYVVSSEGQELEIPRWQGLLDSQFMEPHYSRTGDFEQTSISQLLGQDEQVTTEYQPADAEYGMYGLIKETITKTKSDKVGLFAVSKSKSKSDYSYLKSDFVDINGDGYPERIFGNKIQYTNMTGGHTDLITDNNLSSYINSSENAISGTTGSYSTSYHKALNDFNNDISFISALLKIGNIMGLKDYQNVMSGISTAKGKESPVAISGNASLTLNDAISYNRTNLFLQDLNGDGLPDRISKGNSSSLSYNLRKGYINELSTFDGLTLLNSKPSTISFGFGGGASIGGQNLYEANNTLSQALQGVDLSQSSGFLNGVAPSSIGFNLGVQLGVGSSGSRVLTTYQDLNGDGLLDLLIVGEENGYVSYNLGNKFDTPVLISNNDIAVNLRAMSRTISGNLGVDADLYYGTPIFTLWVPLFIPFCCIIPVPWITLYFKAGLSGALYGSASMNDTRKSFMDFDSDGYVDYLEKDGNQIKIYYSQIKQANKLKSVSNSLGKQFEVDYKLIGNTYDMPMGKWAMSDVYYFNGKTGNEDFSTDDAMHDVIEYGGGYYDRRERQFYGYEKIATKRVSGENTLWTTLNKFHNRSYYLNGYLKEQVVAKDNIELSSFNNCQSVPSSQRFSCKINKYQLKHIESGLVDLEEATTNLENDYDTGGTEGRGIAGVWMEESVDKLYQFLPEPVISTNQYKFDEYSRTITSSLVEQGVVSKYFYPDEEHLLFNQYAIGSPVRTETHRVLEDDKVFPLSSSKTTYESQELTNANGNMYSLVLPKEIYSGKGLSVEQQTGENGETIYIPTFSNDLEKTIDVYDENGIPIQETSRFGVPTTTIYGYGNKLPILVVQGISYEEMSNIQSLDLSSLKEASNADINAGTEDNLRSLLKGAIQTIRGATSSQNIVDIKGFTYDQLVGVTSEINANGLTTKFEYDSHKRLVKVINSQGEVIKSYQYNTVGTLE